MKIAFSFAFIPLALNSISACSNAALNAKVETGIADGTGTGGVGSQGALSQSDIEEFKMALDASKFVVSCGAPQDMLAQIRADCQAQYDTVMKAIQANQILSGEQKQAKASIWQEGSCTSFIDAKSNATSPSMKFQAAMTAWGTVDSKNVKIVNDASTQQNQNSSTTTNGTFTGTTQSPSTPTVPAAPTTLTMPTVSVPAVSPSGPVSVPQAPSTPVVTSQLHDMSSTQQSQQNNTNQNNATNGDQKQMQAGGQISLQFSWVSASVSASWSSVSLSPMTVLSVVQSACQSASAKKTSENQTPDMPDVAVLEEEPSEN